MVAFDTRAVLQHWWDPQFRSGILYKRRTMRVSLKMYLNKVAPVEGASGDLAELVPLAVSLANAYRAMVRAQEAPASNGVEQSQWIGWMVGPLFGEIWGDVGSLQKQSAHAPTGLLEYLPDERAAREKRIARIGEFASSLLASEVVNWESQETVATANLLADSYVKASAELKAVLALLHDDTAVLQHHMTLLNETVSDMLGLILESARPGTARLPEDHFHRIAITAQLNTRAPSPDFPPATGADTALSGVNN